MTEDTTRDIAVKAETNIAAHLADCASFRGRIEKSIEGLFGTLREQDKKMNKQTWVIGVITGAWLTVSWIVEHMAVVQRIIGH